jgi:hypothetical protein
MELLQRPDIISVLPKSSDAERLYLKSSILESSHLARLDPEQAPRVAPGPGFCSGADTAPQSPIRIQMLKLSKVAFETHPFGH